MTTETMLPGGRPTETTAPGHRGTPAEPGGGEGPPTPRAPRRRRWLRRLVAVVGALVFLGTAAVGGFAWFLDQKVGQNVTHEDLLGTRGTTTGTTLQVPAGKGTNILFIGSDARPGDTASRADVIMLMHVTADSHRVYLVHFPRDLYVAIPGHGRSKINAAYAWGGAPLLVQTLQQLTGVRVDHVAKTDFDGFEKMTDAVGGVRVWAAEPSTERGVTITKGWNDLDGAQSLVFVRERHQLSEGDISRGQRQQAFMKALLLKGLSRPVLTNPLTLTGFIDAATQNLVVDDGFTMSRLRSQAFALRSIRSDDIVFITAPFDGYRTVPGVGDVDVVDQAGMRQLGQKVREDDLGTWVDTTTTP